MVNTMDKQGRSVDGYKEDEEWEGNWSRLYAKKSITDVMFGLSVEEV